MEIYQPEGDRLELQIYQAEGDQWDHSYIHHSHLAVEPLQDEIPCFKTLE
jgi:hypothetical protein